MDTTLKGLITSFSRAIDLYNFILKSHHRHTAIAAYHIGKEFGLDEKSISDLVISAALHDIGALSVEERDLLVKMDIENPYPHCRLGSYMLDSFKPFEKISKIVYYHHWPYSKDKDWIEEMGHIPIESYILHLADRTDILRNSNEPVLYQKHRIAEKIESYGGKLFHPNVVEAFKEISKKDSFWLDIENLEMETILDIAISDDYKIDMNMDMLEDFAYTLSKIIDFRSEFTISHSFGVSEVAYTISKLMEYEKEKSRKLRVAGLLHDMGKIAVDTKLIEKGDILTVNEMADVKTHSYFTGLILGNMKGLEEIVSWAACHHENHDGTGYPKSLFGSFITQEMDIVSYADIYTALSENRPYRRGLKSFEIIEILRDEYLDKHGEEVFDVVKNNVGLIDDVCKKSIKKGESRYKYYMDLSKKYENYCL